MTTGNLKLKGVSLHSKIIFGFMLMTLIIVILGGISFILLTNLEKNLNASDSTVVMSHKQDSPATGFNMDQIHASLMRSKRILMLITVIGVMNGCLLGMLIARSIYIPLNRVLSEAEEARNKTSKQLPAGEILDRMIKSLIAIIWGRLEK